MNAWETGSSGTTFVAWIGPSWPRVGEYNVLVGDTVARYKAGEPVLLFAWYPNSATTQMTPGKDLIWLQVSKTDLPGGGITDADTTMKNIVGCAGGSGPCNTGWSRVDYYIGTNKAWLAENPAARKFFELIKMELGDRVIQNIAMTNGEDSEADLRRHANEWIAKNKTQFESWLDQARVAPTGGPGVVAGTAVFPSCHQARCRRATRFPNSSGFVATESFSGQSRLEF